MPNLIASIFQAVKSCTEGYHNFQYRTTANVIVECTDRLRTSLIARQHVFSAVYNYESACKWAAENWCEHDPRTKWTRQCNSSTSLLFCPISIPKNRERSRTENQRWPNGNNCCKSSCEGCTNSKRTAIYLGGGLRFSSGIMKKMHVLVSKFLITERGVLGVNRVIRASASKNPPTEKDHVHWFLQGVLVTESTRSREKNWKLFWAPREESPNHRSFGSKRSSLGGPNTSCVPGGRWRRVPLGPKLLQSIIPDLGK